MASFSYPMGIVWLLIISAPGAESFLTYNPQGQEVLFQCPMPDRLVQAHVSRVAVTGGKATVLAEWRFSQGQGKGESLHDRVSVPKGPTNYLQATLQHVTCYDSATYTYECVTTVDRIPSIATYNQSFQFIGEISPPHLSQDPLKSRYKAGELLSLSCTASVGTEDNGIVWEAGFPGGPFSNVTGEEDPATGRVYEEEQVIRPDCNRESRFPLKYRVQAADDGKIFQCRLRRTGQMTRMMIAVQREGEMCGSSLDKTDSEMGDLELAADMQAETPEYGQLTAERDENADVGAMATSHWLIIVGGIVVIMAIVALSIIIVLRQRKGKQEQPLVVVEGPSPGSASSSESSYSDRDLPGLPDSTTPKWIAESRHRHLENIQQPDSSFGTSIYVSMTAVDRCDAATVPPPPLEEEAGDSLPDMRMDRSESVYSNQSTIEGESVASKSSSAAAAAATAAAATADAATTDVAPTAAPVAVVVSGGGGSGGGNVCVEELKYGNDDESVFIPTFIESI